MKRGIQSLTLSLFIFFVLVINLNLSSAITTCSDNSTLSTDIEEIDEGKTKSVNGLRIGVERADDNVVFRKIFADLILDAQIVSLQNTTVSSNINISGTQYAISLVSATDTKAVIRVNSANSNEIEEGDSETVSGIIVFLKDAAQSGEVASAEIMAGARRISLSSDKLYEKQTINNANYLIKLISASDTNAIVEVQKCATGEIQIEEPAQQPAQQNQTNQTLNNTISNETISAQTEAENAEDENQSTGQVTVAEANERLRQMQEANNTNQSADSQEETQKKQGFFRRFINWIKRLFTFGD